MSNTELLSVASQGNPGVNGTAVNMNGSEVSIDIQASSFGGDGKVVLKARSNYGAANLFKTLEDANTISGLAEYTANTAGIRVSLPAGWQIRADLVITSGTATNVIVIMGE
jgi:hypothetical protein